jgi:hypothetical protein
VRENTFKDRFSASTSVFDSMIESTSTPVLYRRVSASSERFGRRRTHLSPQKHPLRSTASLVLADLLSRGSASPMI